MKKAWIGILATGLVVATAGCIFVGDLLNPAVASSFGLPTGRTNLGSIVIRLSNQASSVAFMSAITSSNSSDPTFGLSGGGDFVMAGESVNLVVDCPVTAIYAAGTENATNAGTNIANPAATVIGDDGGATDVQYTGSVLSSGQDFDCGDVINITLREIAGADNNANAFFITIEVIKGT